MFGGGFGGFQSGTQRPEEKGQSVIMPTSSQPEGRQWLQCAQIFLPLAAALWQVRNPGGMSSQTPRSTRQIMSGMYWP